MVNTFSFKTSVQRKMSHIIANNIRTENFMTLFGQNKTGLKPGLNPEEDLIID